jgi:hypothetical protein
MSSGPVRRKRRAAATQNATPYANTNRENRGEVARGNGELGFWGSVKERVITPLAWLWGGAPPGGGDQLALPPPSESPLSSVLGGDGGAATPGWTFPASEVSRQYVFY